MFIREAPGSLENKTGYPFVGIDGRVLEQIFIYCRLQFQYLITNVVSCRPCTVVYVENAPSSDTDWETYQPGIDYEVYDWNRDPLPEEIGACRPHIDQLVTDWAPHGIVQLGKVATTYNRATANIKGHFPPTLPLTHPAYIARLEYSLVPVLEQARKLETFIESLHNASRTTG